MSKDPAHFFGKFFKVMKNNDRLFNNAALVKFIVRESVEDRIIGKEIRNGTLRLKIGFKVGVVRLVRDMEHHSLVVASLLHMVYE